MLRHELPTIAVLGPSRCGKDTASEWLAARTPLRFAGTASRLITPLAASRLGLTEAEAYDRRHEDRALWFALGNELRAADPAYLVRRLLEGGEIVCGLRSARELDAVRDAGLVDLLVWIDRDVPPDPTLEFDASACDVVVPNRGTLAEFRGRLGSLARFAGLHVA